MYLLTVYLHSCKKCLLGPLSIFTTRLFSCCLSCLSSFCILDISPLVYGGGIVQSLSHIWLFVTPWTAAYQASLSFVCVVCKYVLPSIGCLLTLLIVCFAVQKLFNLMQPICPFFLLLCYVAHPSPKNHCSDQWKGVFLVLYLSFPSNLTWDKTYFLSSALYYSFLNTTFINFCFFFLQLLQYFSLVNLTVRSDAPSSMNWKRKTVPYLCNLHSVVNLLQVRNGLSWKAYLVEQINYLLLGICCGPPPGPTPSPHPFPTPYTTSSASLSSTEHEQIQPCCAWHFKWSWDQAKIKYSSFF